MRQEMLVSLSDLLGLERWPGILWLHDGLNFSELASVLRLVERKKAQFEGHGSSYSTRLFSVMIPRRIFSGLLL